MLGAAGRNAAAGKVAGKRGGRAVPCPFVKGVAGLLRAFFGAGASAPTFGALGTLGAPGAPGAPGALLGALLGALGALLAVLAVAVLAFDRTGGLVAGGGGSSPLPAAGGLGGGAGRWDWGAAALMAGGSISAAAPRRASAVRPRKGCVPRSSRGDSSVEGAVRACACVCGGLPP